MKKGFFVLFRFGLILPLRLPLRHVADGSAAGFYGTVKITNSLAYIYLLLLFIWLHFSQKILSYYIYIYVCTLDPFMLCVCLFFPPHVEPAGTLFPGESRALCFASIFY